MTYKFKKSFMQIAVDKLLEPRNAEYRIQNAIVQYLKLKKILVFAVPNGTNISNPVTRALMILIGLLSGTSDLVIVMNKKNFFVEVKTKSGKQEKTQIEFENNVKELGHPYFIWRDLQDAIDFVENYEEDNKFDERG